MKKAFRIFVGMMASAMLMQADCSVMAQDRFDLKAANGLSFSEIKGYETWHVIAPSYRIDNHELRVILGNSVMIDAYRSGIPENGKPFPEGAIVVKIGWSERKSTAFPTAFEPDVLKRVEFIMKDSKQFSATGGWGYARFLYDAKSGSFAPYGKDASFVQECYQCHTAVKDKDYIFTGYPAR
jgi:hypothetical protein